MLFDAANALNQSLALSYWLGGLWLATALSILPLTIHFRRALKISVAIVCAVDAILFASVVLSVSGIALKAIHGRLLVQGLFVIVPLPALFFDPFGRATSVPRMLRRQRDLACVGLAYLLITTTILCALALIPFGDALVGWSGALIRANPLLFGAFVIMTSGSFVMLGKSQPPPKVRAWIMLAVALLSLWISTLLILIGALASAAFPA